MNAAGVGNLLSVVVFLVVIVQYKLFMVQYKSVDFRAGSVAAVKVPAEFLLANHHHICPLLAEMVNVLKISVQHNFVYLLCNHFMWLEEVGHNEGYEGNGC